MTRPRPALPPPLKPICTGSELARTMQKGVSTIWRWTQEGVIPKSCVARVGRGKQVRYLTAKLRAAGLLPAEQALSHVR